MQLFSVLLVQPIINIIVMFYQMLAWLHVPSALGFAIILMTALIRFILYPITMQQLKAARDMQRIAPHLSKIKEKHKGDMKRQQEATMALYKEHGINPAAGCLPGVVQLVVLIFGLYPAMQKIAALNAHNTVSVINNLLYFPFLHLNHVWDTAFFGLQLGKSPEQLLSTTGYVVLLIPVLTAVFQLIQSRMMMPSAEQNPVPVPTKSKEEDMATTLQKQSMLFLPLITAFYGFKFSIALSLYWNTFTIFGIIQQYKVSGWGALGDIIKRFNQRQMK